MAAWTTGGITAIGQPNDTRPEGSVGTEPAFATVRRGFDPNQVREHLQRVADRIRDLEARLERAQQERDEARREVEGVGTGNVQDALEGVSERVVELMRRFDLEVERIRGEAEIEATATLEDARAEAARLRLGARNGEQQARARADSIVRQARDEADRIKADLAALHDATLNDLRMMRDHMASSVRELDQVLAGEPSEERVIVLEEAGDGASGTPETSVDRLGSPSGL